MQLIELQDTYRWEVGTHTVNHPDLTQVSDDILDFELNQSKIDLENHGFKIESFSTPYGFHNAKVLSFIAKYFDSHRTVWSENNIFPINDYKIKAFSIKIQHLLHK